MAPFRRILPPRLIRPLARHVPKPRSLHLTTPRLSSPTDSIASAPAPTSVFPSIPPPPPPPPPESSPQPPQQPKRPRSLRPYIWATASLALGLLVGQSIRFVVSPPPFPEPGSRADKKLLGSLEKDLDALPVVKELRDKAGGRRIRVGEHHVHDWGWEAGNGYRGRSTGSGSGGTGKTGEARTPLPRDVALDGVAASGAGGDGDGGGWVEITPATTSSSASSGQAAPKSLTRKILAGFRGLGGHPPRGPTLQRAFWHPASRELVQAVWFGGGLSGWPGIVHGGAIATVMAEEGGWCWGLGRGQSLGRGEKGEVGEYILPEPRMLSLTYLKPTTANGFYLIRSRVQAPSANLSSSAGERETAPAQVTSKERKLPPSKDLTKQAQLAAAEEKGDVEVVTTLESLEGTVCVKAVSTFARDGR